MAFWKRAGTDLDSFLQYFAACDLRFLSMEEVTSIKNTEKLKNTASRLDYILLILEE